MVSAAGSLLHTLALICICVLAFSVRIFSVIKYESVIHEFDPYFNYRVTQFLTKEGFYDMWNWFDSKTWYPLGRIIGGTMYPGLIMTAGFIHKILHTLNIPINVQEVCVFTAPLFSAFCALAAYGFVKEVKDSSSGLIAAFFISLVPSYISRSVAGSYDLEAVAIFALMLVFFLYIKTLNTGSLMWATMLCLSYFYMVMSWGGYTFIINLLPIHCIACILTGRLTPRLYVAFAPLIVQGTLLAACIPVVGFNAVLMSEHFGAFFAFAILHAVILMEFVKSHLTQQQFATVKATALTTAAVTLGGFSLLVLLYVLASPTFGWTGRSLSLLDPTYASKYIPIIASVSEHQPPAWTSYIMDLHLAVLLLPAGVLLCFFPLNEATLFLVLYGITAVYFSGVMVRLMLVLAPAACCLAAIACSSVLKYATQSLAHELSQTSPQSQQVEQSISSSSLDDTVSDVTSTKTTKKGKGKGSKKPTVDAGSTKRRSAQGDDSKSWSSWLSSKYPMSSGLSAMVLGIAISAMAFFLVHCIWVSAEMYSAPSIVLQSRGRDGAVHVFDDFREAYSWMSHNTPPDAIVTSWWDYGYQTTAMANRTILVDNNTWNNTHIATVGRAMASPEQKAWQIFTSLDVNYVFVVFGGMVGYPSDDINKFLWMVRIASGVYPEIQERDFLGSQGYRVDNSMSKAMGESLMYKLTYYRFREASAMRVGRPGFDRVRGTEIGKMDVKLKYFEEVFTSEHWMVRVYRVLPVPNRTSKLSSPLRIDSKGKSKSVVKDWEPSGATLKRS